MKAELRRKARAIRRGLSGWSPAPSPLAVAPGTLVASYRPHGHEADPAPFERWLEARGARLAYPRLDADAMRFCLPGPSGFAPGAHGIAAPGADATVVVPAIILLPLLAFDRTGTRLGQGGGHYDRALASIDATKIGIAFAAQEMAALPREPFDVALDAVLTEREWIACR